MPPIGQKLKPRAKQRAGGNNHYVQLAFSERCARFSTMYERVSHPLCIGRAMRVGMVALIVLASQGCATTAPEPYEGNEASAYSLQPQTGTDTGIDYGDPVVAAAARVAGAPYRYGGYTPRGFDCSGLVYYAHRQVGISVPRTTGGQLRHARRVALDNLRPGDVLFFQLEGKKVSHVGIYAGAGSFIHAPSTGKHVSYASLMSEFWRNRLVGAGRFH
jgi:cell wall-associated NlpC family hydrolase